MPSCDQHIDLDAEKKAIIKVLEAETDAYINKDYAAFAAAHLQDESNIRLTAEHNGFDLKTGWVETAHVMKKMFEEMEELDLE